MSVLPTTCHSELRVRNLTGSDASYSILTQPVQTAPVIEDATKDFLLDSSHGVRNDIVGEKLHTASRRFRQTGAVFVMTLVILAGLTAAIVSIAALNRQQSQAQINRMQLRRAKLAAEAGLQRAMAELSVQSPDLTVETDTWATLGNQGSEQFLVGRDSFRVQVVDAASFININTVPQSQLEKLPITEEQRDSWLDWRAAGQTPRPLGAKDEFYNSLPEAYNAKLGAFDTVDELLMVKGFTPNTLYEVQTNVISSQPLVAGGTQQPILASLLTAYSVSRDAGATNSANGGGLGGAKTNANNATLQQLIQMGFSFPMAQAISTRQPFTGLGQILEIPGMSMNEAGIVVERLRVGNATTQTGRININTAGEAVLNSLPGMTSDVTNAILSRQSAGFQQLGELLDIPGMTVDVLAQIIDRVSVNSQVFEVRVIGSAGQIRYPLVATAVLENNSVRILQRREPPLADMRAAWGWEEETSSQTVLSEVNE